MSDSLGDRMKAYENAFRHTLPPRMPIIIRVDGRAFHSYTRNLSKPFCEPFVAVMNKVAIELMQEIQGAQMAYIQSDEISVLVHPYKKFESQPWVSGNLQKLVSLSAGIASTTMTYNSAMIFEEQKPAVFDSRAFVIPESEVTNYFLWRQNDASRNSVQMLARSLVSHKQCHKMNLEQLQDLCIANGQNWNDLPTYQKRGRCVIRKSDESVTNLVIDNEIPIWKNEGRQYIDDLLATDSEDNNKLLTKLSKSVHLKEPNDPYPQVIFKEDKIRI